MANIKLTVEYEGTHFRGWQIQDKKSRTVQGEIEKVLLKLCKEKVRLIGTGRTDSGVHALKQVANFKTTSQRSLQEMLKALNGLLAEDIAILEIRAVAENFHARYSAKSKTYRYTILNREIRSPLFHDFSLFYPWKLDLSLMRKEA